MTVGELMTKKIVTVELDDTIETIRHIFKNVNFHHLLVIEDGKLAGVISDRDYFKAITPFLNTNSERPLDRAAMKRKAHQIMSHKSITVNRDVSIEVAAHLLLKKGISCLPVVTSENEIEGIITWKDLLHYYIKGKAPIKSSQKAKK